MVHFMRIYVVAIFNATRKRSSAYGKCQKRRHFPPLAALLFHSFRCSRERLKQFRLSTRRFTHQKWHENVKNDKLRCEKKKYEISAGALLDAGCHL